MPLTSVRRPRHIIRRTREYQRGYNVRDNILDVFIMAAILGLCYIIVYNL
jgi:hypothetical protein